MDQHFDLILTGGGLAGLSLAYQLTRSQLNHQSILIIDRDQKTRNDRTWSFWLTENTLFDSIAFRTWNQLRFFSHGFQREYELSPFRYRLIRGIDFYAHVQQHLKNCSNVHFIYEPVDKIEDGETQVVVTAGGKTFTANWVMNSIFQPGEIAKGKGKYHFLKQHFRGWHLRTRNDCFNPESPVLFDFRTPQDGKMRFFYILPFSSKEALVEYTLFSADVLEDNEYDDALREYIHTVLRIDSFEILDVENGIIPMTDYPFARRGGKRILNTGTAGGRVKPSSGYAFLRIIRDNTNIIQSLLSKGTPFAIPADRPIFRYLDSVMLQLMYRRGDIMESVFTDLFRNNSIQRIFRFLDESASVFDLAGILTSVPPVPFLQAWYRLKVLRKV